MMEVLESDGGRSLEWATTSSLGGAREVISSTKEIYGAACA